MKQNPFYDGEVTLFYTNSTSEETIANNDSMIVLVKKGLIVFDYEKIDNLEERFFDKKSIFMTNSTNPVYLDSGLNGEYFTIPYIDKNIQLYVYGNDSIDLRELIQSLDL